MKFTSFILIPWDDHFYILTVGHLSSSPESAQFSSWQLCSSFLPVSVSPRDEIGDLWHDPTGNWWSRVRRNLTPLDEGRCRRRGGPVVGTSVPHSSGRRPGLRFSISLHSFPGEAPPLLFLSFSLLVVPIRSTGGHNCGWSSNGRGKGYLRGRSHGGSRRREGDESYFAFSCMVVVI